MPEQNVYADLFWRARVVAATGTFIAGVLGIAGPLLDWVSVEPPDNLTADDAPLVAAFHGIEILSGKVILVGGILLCVIAVLMMLRAGGGPAAVGLLASMIVGAIAFADFRAVTDLNSDLIRRFDIVGNVSAGVGLIMVSASGVLGMIASIAGIVASPKAPREQAS